MQYYLNEVQRRERAERLRYGQQWAIGQGVPVGGLPVVGQALDVSYHQGVIDWKMVRARHPELVFVAIKAGGADIGRCYTDPQFNRNWNEARKVGFERMAYWFASPFVETDAQAEYYDRLLGTDRGELNETTDVEWPSRNMTTSYLSNMLGMMQIWDVAFGYYPVCYSAAWWWRGPWSGLSNDERARIDWGRVSLWAASYTDVPVLFAPWQNCALWQYTDKGRVEGIDRPVDLNWVYSIEALRRPERGNGGSVPTLPAQAKTTRNVEAMSSPDGNGGRKLWSVHVPNADVTVTATKGSKAKVKVTNFEAWIDLSAIRFDQPEPPKPEPPKPTGGAVPAEWQDNARYLLGVWCGNMAAARRVLALGGRSVLVQNDVAGAAELKRQYPDALVAARRVTRDKMDAVTYVRWLGVPSDAQILVTGINETDVAGYDYSPSGIRARAKWDGEVAAELKRVAPGVVYVAGGWAEGNPDNLHTSAEVQRAVTEGYLDGVNTGKYLFDYHGYTVGKGKNFRANDPYYREKRWQMLQEVCGFGAARRMICTEIGVEADPILAGGFKAKGYTLDEFKAWANYWLEMQREPRCSVLGGFIFHLSQGSNEFTGFEMEGYLGALAEIWKGG